MKALKGEELKNSLQITGQFRSKNTMVYDFRGSGNRLTLRITQRELPSDLNEWRVEASMGRSAEAVLTGWGADPTVALREVAQQWRDRCNELGLPEFEWETIQSALTNVRAL